MPGEAVCDMVIWDEPRQDFRNVVHSWTNGGFYVEQLKCTPSSSMTFSFLSFSPNLTLDICLPWYSISIAEKGLLMRKAHTR